MEEMFQVKSASCVRKLYLSLRTIFADFPEKFTNFIVEGGHFLNFDLARFDANFFGLSALEASALDPQQRLLLECTWECVEQAGCNSPKDLEQCGVFIGFMSNEYQDLSEQQGNALQMLGTSASAFSGRLAHFLDCRQYFLENSSNFL